MRKIYSILLCVLCLSAVGCSDDKDTADVALKAIRSDVKFSADGGTGTIELSGGKQVSATSDVAWCKVASVSDQEVSLVVEANLSISSRTTMVVIQSGEDILQVPVTQLGDTFICDVEGTKDFLMQGGEAVFTLHTRREYSIQSTAEWLTYELKGDHSPISGIRENDNSWNDPNPNGYNYAYIRAILGLAEQYEFQLETPYQKAIVKIKSANNCISRYKSPLLFKIINNSIYLVGNEINTEILNKPFQYSYIEQTKNKNMRTGKSEITERTMHINEIEMNYNNRINYHYTPTSFSLIDFMQYAMSYKKNGKNILNYIPLKQ